jgi:hypothetical protein
MGCVGSLWAFCGSIERCPTAINLGALQTPKQDLILLIRLRRIPDAHCHLDVQVCVLGRRGGVQQYVPAVRQKDIYVAFHIM